MNYSQAVRYVVILSIGVMGPFSSWSGSGTHRVKPGESVGSILNHLGYCPLWGSKGSVRATYELNNIPYGQQIPEGMELKLPMSFPSLAKADFDGEENIAYCKLDKKELPVQEVLQDEDEPDREPASQAPKLTPAQAIAVLHSPIVIPIKDGDPEPDYAPSTELGFAY